MSLQLSIVWAESTCRKAKQINKVQSLFIEIEFSFGFQFQGATQKYDNNGNLLANIGM